MANANAQTMAIVAEIFAAFPNRFRFTSGIRTPAQNAAANGVPNSYHLTGEAADFVAINGQYPPGEKEAIARIAARHGYEVIFHNAGSGLHYHIEPAPSGSTVPTGVQIDTPSVPKIGLSPTAIALGFGFLIAVLLLRD